MMMLVVGMVLVTPAMACPAGTDCSQTSIDCTTCGILENITHVTKLDSEIIDKNLIIALKSDGVNKLIKELELNGYKLNQSSTVGLGITLANGSYMEGIALPFESTDNSLAGIYVIIENNDISKVEAKIIHKDEDQFPTSVDVLTVNENSIIAESANVSSVISNMDKKSLSSTIGLTSVSPKITISKCTACKELYNIGCAIGCGVEMQLLCTAAGIANIAGGLACVVLAGIVCTLIADYGCSKSGTYICTLGEYCP